MSGAPPTPNYDPSNSVFEGGKEVPITSFQGGGGLQEGGELSFQSVLSGVSPLLGAASGGTTAPAKAPAGPVSVPYDTSQFSAVPASSQPSIIAAATTAAMTATKAGATPEIASAAGIYAGSQQALSELNKTNLTNVNISDDDAKILHSARDAPNQEKALAISAGTEAYNAAISAGSTPTAAMQARVYASVKAIKEHRMKDPYDDPTLSLKYTQSEANAILATKDPKAQELGQAAYNSAYASAKARNKSDADAVEIATLAKVEAIDNYTKVPVSVKGSALTTITDEKAEKIFASATEDEKVLAIDAKMRGIADAKKKGVTDPAELERYGIIAAAEKIDLYRGERKASVLTPRVIGKNRSSAVIKAVEALPLYLEYSQVEKTLQGPYNDLYKKRQAEADLGKNFLQTMKQKMTFYESRQRTLWLQQTNGAPSLPQTKAPATYAAGEVFTSFSRLTYVLPITISDIIVLPPVNGNVAHFLEALQTLDKMGIINSDLKIKENVVVVCVPPFYSINGNNAAQLRSNTILLSFVLDINANNPGQWVTLAENTSEAYLIGSTLAGKGAKDTIINMLEPSYVLYPYRRKGLEGILISSSPQVGVHLPKDSAKKFSLEKDVYASKNFGKAMHIAYKPDLRAEAAEGYFTVLGSLNPLTIPKENIGSCGLANYSLPELIPTLHPSKKIQLSAGIILGFRLRVEGIYEPICVAQKVETKETQTKFVGSPEAIISPAEIGHPAPFEIAGKMFQIRRSNKQDKVYENWKAGIYTQSEADLLNIINLKPIIMDKIFPPSYDANGVRTSASWKEWVANFLSTVTISNKSLKTHRETMVVRNFLERVRSYFINHKLNHDLEESDSDDETVKRQHGLLEPDGLDSIENETFEDIKRKWGELDVYENTETKEWICSIILVHKQTYRQMYRTVGVPLAEFNSEANAKIALKEKIAGLKKKYSDWIFIY